MFSGWGVQHGKTAKLHRLSDVITELHLQMAHATTSAENFISVAQLCVDVATIWGPTVNLLKTNGMNISADSSFADDIPVGDQSVKMLKEFPYLGSIISNDEGMDIDLRIRIV